MKNKFTYSVTFDAKALAKEFYEDHLWDSIVTFLENECWKKDCEAFISSNDFDELLDVIWDELKKLIKKKNT